jgi:hypothetical protein
MFSKCILKLKASELSELIGSLIEDINPESRWACILLIILFCSSVTEVIIICEFNSFGFINF